MNYHDNRKLIMFFEELTFTYFSGEMWLNSTSDCSKNIINVILLEWNLITFPPSCPKYTKMEKIKTFYTIVIGATNFCTVSLFQAKFVSTQMDFKVTSLGQIKNNPETVQVMPVCHIWPGFVHLWESLNKKW